MVMVYDVASEVDSSVVRATVTVFVAPAYF